MRRSVLLLCGLLLGSALAHAQVDQFRVPWRDTTRAIVIDPYEGNTIVWDSLALDRRVVGIIHRGTIGSRADKAYAGRRAEGKRRGYLWGSYHLGRPGSATAQADFYLASVRPDSSEVTVLDVEGLDSARDMSLDSARTFLLRVYQKTGRWPMLYANHRVVSAISTRFPGDTVFARVPLWYARFRQEVPDFPTTIWSSYALWQFSCEINCDAKHPEECLYRVPGTRADMDISVYNGTSEDIRRWWRAGGR